MEVVQELLSGNGRTQKVVWRLHDGAEVESVAIRHVGRVTVCVSSQAGCAMACPFCATGQGGFTRNLGAGEIVGQVVGSLGNPATGGTNVVFMGMGEPLSNVGPVLDAIETLVGLGVGRRRITVSTVGIVPGIRRLAAAEAGVRLALSVHAANDELRDALVPVNRRYPLAEVVAACRAYGESSRRRVSLEWTLIKGVNDRPSDAAELAELAREMRAHVNLIPINPTPGYPGRTPGPTAVRAFCRTVSSLGAPCSIRRNHGGDIAAACGQLRRAPGAASAAIG